MNRALKGKLINAFYKTVREPTLVGLALSVVFGTVGIWQVTTTDQKLTSNLSTYSDISPVGNENARLSALKELAEKQAKLSVWQREVSLKESFDKMAVQEQRQASVKSDRMISDEHADYLKAKADLAKQEENIAEESLFSPYLTEKDLRDNVALLKDKAVQFRDECLKYDSNHLFIRLRPQDELHPPQLRRSSSEDRVLACMKETKYEAESMKDEAFLKNMVSMLGSVTLGFFVPAFFAANLKKRTQAMRDDFDAETLGIQQRKLEQQEELKVADVKTFVEGGISREIVVKKRLQLRAPNGGKR